MLCWVKKQGSKHNETSIVEANIPRNAIPPQPKLPTAVIMRHIILCLVLLLFGAIELVLAAGTRWPNVDDSPLLRSRSRGLAVETEQEVQYCDDDTCSSEDGFFCTYEPGTSRAVCQHCESWGNIQTPLDCTNRNDELTQLHPAGQESCMSSCSSFQYCDDQTPCPTDGDVSFCTFHDKGSNRGVCQDCNNPHLQTPLDCKRFSGDGREDCIDACFQYFSHSIDDIPCPPGSFCTNLDMDVGTSGAACMSCDGLTPLDCSDPEKTADGEESCALECFDMSPCSEASPCPTGFFCTYQSDDSATSDESLWMPSSANGCCLGCHRFIDPIACLFWDFPATFKESCASTCFNECSVDNPCKDGFFCNYELETSGFCSSCLVTPSHMECKLEQDHMEWEESKFQPTITTSVTEEAWLDAVEDILRHNNTNQTVTPTISQIQKSNMCMFCPNNDMKYPDRHMRMWVRAFGPKANCSDLETYFSTVPTNPNSRDCRLAQMMDHTCGCTGNGYGGADSTTKMAVLAWFPRCMAFLSFMGSSIILFNIITLENKRRKTFNQFMILLSLFDMIGSVAYSFTTLPLPAEDYMYGSRGNTATCTAQGFFIQLGVIAAYMNVSLSFYYLLILKFGWNESRIDKLRPWLFGVPIVIGLTFAFAGIPYYDNMILWCNNTADIWPDIPMAIAIIVATVNMGLISWHVYKEETVSRKWRSGSQQNSLSSKVFRQSILYLLAFYLVWPPYLVLQYLWAAGSAFDKFGFILFAGVTVPLQGFWNCLAYMLPRMKKRRDFLGLRSTISRLSTKITKSVGRKTSQQSYKDDIIGTTKSGIPSQTTALSSVGLKSSRESVFEVSIDVDGINICPLGDDGPSAVICEANVNGAHGAGEQIIENKKDDVEVSSIMKASVPESVFIDEPL